VSGALLTVASLVPLLIAAGAVTIAQPQPEAAPAAPSAMVEHAVMVAVPDGAAAAPAFEVLEQGVSREVLGTDRYDASGRGWQIVVYADLPLATPEAVRLASEQLADEAERLVALGEVTVVSATAGAHSLGGPTRDAEELRAILGTLSGAASDAGELLAARRDALAESGRGDSGPFALVQRHEREEELRDWQQDVLEDWLFGVLPGGARFPPSRPRALFLIRDGVDTDGVAWFRDRLGDRLEAGLDTRLRTDFPDRHRRFVRTLSALGWTGFALRARPEQDLLGARRPGDDLASDTGGAAITLAGSTGLGVELGALERRWRVRYHSPLRDDEPFPLSVRPTTAQGAVRAPRWATGAPPRLLPEVYARRLLQDEVSGPLAIATVLLEQGRGTATLEAVLETSQLEGGGDPGSLTSDRLRVTLIAQRQDRAPEVLQHRGQGTELDSADTWVLRTLVELPEDLDALVVVVEDLRSARWGAAVAEHGDESLVASLSAPVVETASLGGAPLLPATAAGDDQKRGRGGPAIGGAPDRGVGGARDGSDAARYPGALTIVPPPTRAPLAGTQEFDILLSTDIIERVDFLLDGKQVAEDDNRPFSARIDLGADPTPRMLEAIGYGYGNGLIARDRLELNVRTATVGIKLTRVDPVAGSEQLDIAADVSLPRESELDRVELYRNEHLAATLTAPPFTTRVPGPARADTDYVRAVAILRSGEQLEDVRMVGSSVAATEVVDVNLVQVYAVVTDGDGHPIRGLESKDFTLRQGRREIEVERFALAEEVPLVVGLVVDTSESMWPLMEDTRRAAARFLGTVLTPIDSAFLVDFDDRPRLAHATTGRTFDLIESLGTLRASGATALYDSVLFGLLQFEPGTARRAVVLLTDGDDVESRFSYRRVWNTAKSGSVPVYFVALGGFASDRPSFRKSDLEGLAEASGGRVFYANDMAAVQEAYDRIAQELRAQYVLAFSSPQALSESDLAEIRLEVAGPGQLRFVVGQR
jgi:VWFA-related protein